MPFVTLLTNLKASAFSGDAMPNLVRHIAPLLGKPVERFNWILETDKMMSKGGPDNADKPFVWIKLEAIGNFEDSENVKTINKSLYNYLETEMNLEKDWVIINYYKLQKTHVATQGKTVAEA